MKAASTDKFMKYAALVSAGAVISYLVFMNIAPQGARQHIADDKQFNLGPSRRVTSSIDNDGKKVWKQFGDLVYFENRMIYSYDKAKLTMKIKSSSSDQEVKLGYRDRDIWHYSVSPSYAPFIDSLDWSRVGDGPFLYQRHSTYQSVAEFIEEPPRNSLIGVYDYDAAALNYRITPLQNYTPAKQDTEITTPLRGKVTLYAYLENQPFYMRVEKQDLNWYEDPDAVNIRVYKSGDQVFEAVIDDDGNVTDNRRIGGKQSIRINNPGPELPEAGVYKIVIDSPDDAVVTKITTNLHKLVFDTPLYPVSNREVYGDLVGQTTPTVLYSNAFALTAETHHEQFQTINVGTKKVRINKAHDPVPIDTGSATATINIPLSDVVIHGVGYFAFTKAQFFEPTPYHIMKIANPQDLAKVDYVLTHYKPPKKLAEDWVEVTREFDLRDAITQKGMLSWVIDAAGLEENKRTIQIKDIELTLTKEGWAK
jgi:hypothetical protein